MTTDRVTLPTYALTIDVASIIVTTEIEMAKVPACVTGPVRSVAYLVALHFGIFENKEGI